MRGYIKFEKLIQIEVIPFKNFKHKLQIIKKHEKNAKIEIFSNYVIIQKIEIRGE